MDVELREMIDQTFGEVFETMFFTFLDPVEELPSRAELVLDDAYVEAVIAYHGPRPGRFFLYLPYRLARNITMNFLGVDEDEVSDEQALDTAKETANMAVGSLLGRLDPEGTLKLHIPESRMLDGLPADELLVNPGLCLFNTDLGLLWVVYEG